MALIKFRKQICCRYYDDIKTLKIIIYTSLLNSNFCQNCNMIILANFGQQIHIQQKYISLFTLVLQNK